VGRIRVHSNESNAKKSEKCHSGREVGEKSGTTDKGGEKGIRAVGERWQKKVCGKSRTVQKSGGKGKVKHRAWDTEGHDLSGPKKGEKRCKVWEKKSRPPPRGAQGHGIGCARARKNRKKKKETRRVPTELSKTSNRLGSNQGNRGSARPKKSHRKRGEATRKVQCGVRGGGGAQTRPEGQRP